MKQPFRQGASHTKGERQRAESRPMIAETLGIWINKRAIAFIDLPFRHNLIGETAGWRVEVSEPGKLVVTGRGLRRRIDVEEGDFLMSAGDDIYIGLQRAPTEQTEETETGRPKERRKGEGD